MTRIADHLAQLPSLAARTAPAPRPRQTTTAGGIDPTRIIRPEPGPRLPPGLNLDTIDQDLHRQPSRDLLGQLSQCVRIVIEEVDPQTWRTFPNLAPEDQVTWTSETSWLLATMHWWSTDTYCNEWIQGEVGKIRTALIERIEKGNGWTICALCGEEITTYSTQTVDVAECQRCDRVVSMRERDSLTTGQMAKLLGISEAAVRKRIERGQLRKVGRRGKESLIALDTARRRLALLA
jgi:DNA-binding XRE family transcriptional regulator